MINHGYNRLEHQHDIAKNTVVINWCLTDVCNYKCHYCLHSLNCGEIGFPNVVDVLSFCRKIIDVTYPKKIYFEFTGGEVTLWKYLPLVIDNIKQYSNVSVGIISNSSRSLSWWSLMRDKLDHVCLSFHPSFADRDHYIKVVKLLSNHLRIHTNFMMDPDYFDICKDLAFEMATTVPNISMALQPLLVDFKDELYDYSKDQIEIIDRQYELYGSLVKWTRSWDVYRGAMKMISDKKTIMTSAQRFISDKTNKWKGWKCWAGVEQMVVDLNGNVWRGWCKEGGSLGNISSVIDYETKPIICNRDYCHCNFDIMCTKEKI
jgi:hypothetical protein